ncbi:hypothetical protein NKI80_23355 [Mesorhizobium sp. M0387]
MSSVAGTSNFASDVVVAQESNLSFNLTRHAGFESWLADADCCHQLADGNNLDFRSDDLPRVISSI